MQHNKNKKTYIFFDNTEMIIYGDKQLTSSTEWRIYITPNADGMTAHKEWFMKEYIITSQMDNIIWVEVVKIEEFYTWIKYIWDDECDAEFKLTNVKDMEGNSIKWLKISSLKGDEISTATSLEFEILTIFDENLYPSPYEFECVSVDVSKCISDLWFKKMLKYWTKNKEENINIRISNTEITSQSLERMSQISENMRLKYWYELSVSDESRSFNFCCEKIEIKAPNEEVEKIYNIKLSKVNFYRIFSSLKKLKFKMTISFDDHFVLAIFEIEDQDSISISIRSPTAINSDE